jgi:HdeA/HdeB family
MKSSFALGCVMTLVTSLAHAQTPLTAYADSKGYIHVQELTCAQLAGTYQEDADFLGVWYSGWYNGLGKKNTIKVDRVKDGIHEVIVYCKAHQDKKVIQAIDFILNGQK